MSYLFQENDPVLLIYDQKRQWIRKVTHDIFHSNFGGADLSELIGKPFGTSIQTSKGKWLYAYPPTMIDWINNFKHHSQIIYEKDAAMISILVDAKPGDIIYEAGTGSGALTFILANAVGTDGKIVTHDKREQAILTAQQNIAQTTISNVEFHCRDIVVDGFVEGTADGVVLDMGEAWNVIDKVALILRPGGKLVVFLPTFDQLGKIYDNLLEYGFKGIKAIELIEREIQIKPGAIRPATRMIGHTGFLVTATLSK